MNPNYLKKNNIRYIPTCGNLIFYNESNFSIAKELLDINKKIKKSLGSENSYELFLHGKRRRPVYDIYACYHPFNEATKSLYPFLNILRKKVTKGDVILNLWDRSGWITNLLSGLFPEQTIVTTWEGNKDVLGYKGYKFWTQNAENVNIVFCNLNDPLPFADNSVVFAVGIDTFHRFHQASLLEELLRVVKDDGAILFPHVHLTNSEPQPYFDRGCKQLHGLDYDNIFQLLANGSNWEGYVFSEPDLFAQNDIYNTTEIPLISNPNTKDYNSLLAILPKTWHDETLSFFSLKDIHHIKEARIVVNLIVNVDLNLQLVSIDYDYLEGIVGHLLERHPVYVDRIKKLNNFKLSSANTKILYLAKLGFSVSEICKQLSLDFSNSIIELEKLESIGLIQVLPVSYDAVRLQNYLTTQDYIVDSASQNLKSLWIKAVENFSSNLAIISLQDGSEFSYGDCDGIVKSILLSLHNLGLKKNDKILIAADVNVEATFLFWACMKAGIVVIPISTNLVNETVSYIFNLTKPDLFFASESFYEKINDLSDIPKPIIFDVEEQKYDGNYFSDWLSKHSALKSDFYEIDVNQADEAVILFTSGSTGIPKGVVLSHGSLYRSGQLITDSFNWLEKDRFFAIGGLDSMSGLRNSVVAPLFFGSSCIIPQADSLHNAFLLADDMAESRASIVATNPSFLRLLVTLKEKIGRRLNSLTTVMCTGNNLAEVLRSDFKLAYNLNIINYYGLTETAGICISQNYHQDYLGNNEIGSSVGCIAQIVDENDQLVGAGEIGELRIFSSNLMKGYYMQSELTSEVIREGWFYTGDLVRRSNTHNFQLIGRKKAIIKTASDEIVYLNEIKVFVFETGLVSESEIDVYVDNDIEKYTLYVVLKDQNLSVNLVKKQIRDLLINKFGIHKIPQSIIVLSSIPYSPTGKFLKNQHPNEL